MARHHVKRDHEKGSETGGLAAPSAPMQGGTSGEPPDPNPRSETIFGLASIQPAREEEPSDAPPAKRYLVTGGPEFVMYAGAKVNNRLGKIYTETCTDLDLLRRQGVELQELTE